MGGLIIADDLLPPREVPPALTPIEYQQLLYRYFLLGWNKQATTALKYQVSLNKPDKLSDEGQKNVIKLVQALEAGLVINEHVTEVETTVNNVMGIALNEADKFLDQFHSISKAKESLKGTVQTFSQLAQQGFGKVVEDVVLPTVGMPVDGIPAGKSLSQYLLLARQYERFGWAELAREACERVIEQAPDSEEAKTARKSLHTRFPKRTVSRDAMSRNMEGLKQLLLGKLPAAKEIFQDLVKDYPHFDWAYANLGRVLIKQGEIRAAHAIVTKVLKQNPNYLNGWVTMATIHIVAWKMPQLSEAMNKMTTLDPADKSVEEMVNLYGIFRSQGFVRD